MSASNPSPEYAGCDVEGNVWINIGIPRAQARRLKQAAKIIGGPHKSSHAAWLLINCALKHLPLMERLLNSDRAEFWHQVHAGSTPSMDCHYANAAEAIRQARN